MQERSTLIVEAGTGTGKTFAYLAPALLSGKRVIISTGTRALQDQLFHRDLPQLCGAMGRPAQLALLKGRANYLVPAPARACRAAGVRARRPARGREGPAARATVVADDASRRHRGGQAVCGGNDPVCRGSLDTRQLSRSRMPAVR
jgi:ATP-dependent DNA helicase DinG